MYDNARYGASLLCLYVGTAQKKVTRVGSVAPSLPRPTRNSIKSLRRHEWEFGKSHLVFIMN